MEQLVDQVLFNPHGPRQEVREKHLGKGWLLMENADDSRLLQPHDLAIRHCRGCRYPQRLSDQASLAAKLVRSEKRNNGFLPMLGNDGDLDLSFLDVEHRVRRIALPEDRLVLLIFGDGSAPIHGGEKYHRVKGDFFQLLCHDRLRFAAPHGQNRLTLGPTPVPSCDLGVTGEYERLRSHNGRARAAYGSNIDA